MLNVSKTRLCSRYVHQVGLASRSPFHPQWRDMPWPVAWDRSTNLEMPSLTPDRQPNAWVSLHIHHALSELLTLDNPLSRLRKRKLLLTHAELLTSDGRLVSIRLMFGAMLDRLDCTGVEPSLLS
jgi:hypothetical protein